METIIASAISSCLLLAGTVYTVRRSRVTTTQQHMEQTQQLTNIQHNQSIMLDTIMAHKEHAESKLDLLNDRVTGLQNNQDLLFNMVAEVDLKVTKPGKKRVTLVGDGLGGDAA